MIKKIICLILLYLCISCSNNTNSNIDLNGKFKTEFRPEKPYPGLGLFTQNGNLISGTFKKNSGDTRYLSGIVSGDSI